MFRGKWVAHWAMTHEMVVHRLFRGVLPTGQARANLETAPPVALQREQGGRTHQSGMPTLSSLQHVQWKDFREKRKAHEGYLSFRIYVTL